MDKSVGEEAITPQAQNQVASDVVSPQGIQGLHQKLASTIEEKSKLDYIFKGIADKLGVDFESRVKNPDTVIKKIAQKRIQGRDYNLEDINDAYGGRFIVKDKSKIPQIQAMLRKAEELGIISINKQEDVHSDTYHAIHTDFETPNGVRGEAQIMTPQEALESVSNHSLRAVYGEKPPKEIEALRNRQAEVARKTPHSEAITKAQMIQQIGKQNNGKPLDPRLIATILTKS